MNRSLMEEVIARPDDDDVREVYADWCEEQGDLPRASFIRVQLERARRDPWDARQVALEVAERALLEAHGATWLGEVADVPGVTWTGFERGFVARAEAESFGALVKGHDALARAAPLHHVTAPWPTSEREAAGARAMGTLRGLRIERAIIDPREPLWLAASPLLSTLTELALVDGYADAPGTHALLTSPHLRGLRELSLARHLVGREGVVALVEVDLPELVALQLEERGTTDDSWSHWDGGLDVPAMERLARWPGLARIRRLDLGGNRIEPEGFEALFESEHFTAVESLKLQFVYAMLAEIPWGSAPGALRLKALDLGDSSVSTEAAQVLAAAPCLAELRQLDLPRAQAEEATALPTLLDGGLAETLQVLDLGDFDSVEAPVVSALVGADLPQLHTLRLGSAYDIGDGDVERLVGWRHLEHLRSLAIAGKSIGSETARALAAAPLDQLERLRVRGLPEDDRALLRETPIGQRLLRTGGLELLAHPQRGW